VASVICRHSHILETCLGLFQHHGYRDLMAFTIDENLSSQFPSFSIIVPMTMMSAPALAICPAVSGDFLPQLTMRVTSSFFLTAATISGETFWDAPEPASR